MTIRYLRLPLNFKNVLYAYGMGVQWLSGRGHDSRPRGPRVSSLAGVTALCPNPSLVLVHPRKTHPHITERLLMGHKESNQTNKMCIEYAHFDTQRYSSVAHCKNVPLNTDEQVKDIHPLSC